MWRTSALSFAPTLIFLFIYLFIFIFFYFNCRAPLNHWEMALNKFIIIIIIIIINSATSLMLIVFPTQVDRQVTPALNSTEADDSAPSSGQNTIISYLSEDIMSVRQVFQENQSTWSVLLMLFSSSNPLRYGKRYVPYCRVFSK